MADRPHPLLLAAIAAQNSPYKVRGNIPLELKPDGETNEVFLVRGSVPLELRPDGSNIIGPFPVRGEIPISLNPQGIAGSTPINIFGSVPIPSIAPRGRVLDTTVEEPGSGSPPYSIPAGAAGNLKLWLHPEEGVSRSGSAYISESDFSSAEATIAPSTSTPAFISGNLNGKGIVRTTTGNLISTITPTFNLNARAFTIFIVAKATGTARNRGFISAATGPRYFSITTTETGTFWAFSGIRFSTYAADTDWHIWEYVSSASGIEWFRDGVSIYTASALSSDTAIFNQLEGQVLDRADVIVFDAAIGSGDRATLRASLQSTYGL